MTDGYLRVVQVIGLRECERVAIVAASDKVAHHEGCDEVSGLVRVSAESIVECPALPLQQQRLPRGEVAQQRRRREVGAAGIRAEFVHERARERFVGCVERTLFLHRGQIPSSQAFLQGIKNALAKRRLVEALTLCEEAPGPVAAVVKAALLHADASADEMRFNVQEAAVISVPHPKWAERPLAIIVLKPKQHADEADIRAHLAKQFVKWMVPDGYVFVDAIPRTSTGKFLKTKLREQYREWKWPETTS